MEEASTQFKVLLLIFGLVLIGVLGYMVWQSNSYIVDTGTETVVKKSTKKTTTSQTTTTKTTSALTYTDTKCGFTLTFTDKWTGYKMKHVAVDGATDTYYVNVPTTNTDPLWTTEYSTHFAKYVSMFAISTYTQAQWTAAIAQPAEIPTKMGQCGSYIVGYDLAQAYPTDIQDKGLAAEVKAIVATFKAT